MPKLTVYSMPQRLGFSPGGGEQQQPQQDDVDGGGRSGDGDDDDGLDDDVFVLHIAGSVVNAAAPRVLVRRQPVQLLQPLVLRPYALQRRVGCQEGRKLVPRFL